MIKKIIIISVIFGVLSSGFSFVHAQHQLTPPETLEEAKTIGGKALRLLPEALKKPWQEALIIWQKMWIWVKSVWDSYILPKIESLWQKILSLFGKEVKKRESIIKEEFEKEKEEIKKEIKTEAPKTGKNLWERFKELIK